ncbi:MAG: septation protein SpoVG family protein [Candidatus Omnitrophota bacterium]|nr:septation protein SpoVG family protein [Candidatus Omnitrophota bacterium]
MRGENLKKMNGITVSEIQISPVKLKDGLVAFASCVINGQFYLGGLAIYTCPSFPQGFRIVYPTKVLHNGTQLSLFHPITKEAGLVIQEQIVEKYLKLMEDLAKGDAENEQEWGPAQKVCLVKIKVL